MAKRALVSGVTGQDGSFLAELLLQKGYEVFGLVRRLSTPNFANIRDIADRITLLDGDLIDQSSLNAAVKEAQPDEVYSLAAQSFVGTSFVQPVLTGEITGLGVVRMLEAVKAHAPGARMYQASSSEMFGKVTSEPQNEQTLFHPRSPYGVAKVFAYWACINYREAYSLFVSNGILFNHESQKRGLEFVTRKISHGVARIALGKKEPISLGNLDAKRDWGYAPEYVEGMWLMLQQPAPDDFVLATGEQHSVREFVERAFAEVGRTIAWRGKGLAEAGVDAKTGDVLVAIDPRYFRPTDVDSLVGNPAKAREKLGWRHRTCFADLVAVMVRSDLALYRSSNDGR